MPIVTVRTELAAPAEVVWAAVCTPHAFAHVASPVLRFPVAERTPGPWEPGTTVEGWLLLFGVVPVSRHRLTVAEIDHAARRLRSHERGGLVRTWNHDIEVDPTGVARCRYVDRIEIEAGIVTPIIVAFAHLFYRHRQRRWRRLAPLLAAATAAGREPVGAPTCAP